MMYLGLWFKRMILVLLLSVFLEFLLPSNLMQRYVRLVMGFVLITIMLLPISQFLHIDINQVEQQVLQMVQGGSMTNSSLSSILQQGEQLKRQDARQSVSDWETHLNELIKNQLQQRFSIQADSVSVHGDPGNKQTGAAITSVDIRLPQIGSEKKPNAATSTAMQSSLHIAPVQPLPSLKTDSIQKADSLSTAQATLSPQEKQIKQQVQEYLQQQLSVPQQQIHISFDDSIRR
ncbi:stage III sporulation protein AF [Fodinisporobacter ferrooxydans]|uniref:Stage III sporulation protein AF n=1 Tax=Fodinisporobacter ferrooxydans TaxID=2901836 RepID=A0ABY4CR09_9BACL|nr:stage III sporulation protein AF [Alicyclobacillaceae bacterium MYW30-H2]